MKLKFRGLLYTILATITLSTTACYDDETNGSKGDPTPSEPSATDMVEYPEYGFAVKNLNNIPEEVDALEHTYTLTFDFDGKWSLSSTDPSICKFHPSSGEATEGQDVTMVINNNLTSKKRTVKPIILVSKHDEYFIDIAQTGISLPTAEWGKNRAKTASMGVADIAIVQGVDGAITFKVEAVYQNSPAIRAGIRRGTIITQIDKINLTVDNYGRLAQGLLYPSAGENIVLTDSNNKLYNFSATTIESNPLLKFRVDEYEGKKIGYIAYHMFDADYDAELLGAIKLLRDKGINELVLDLRTNGGGHVVTSNMLSSCIAGDKAKSQVFTYYRYNDERMAKQGDKMTAEKFSISYSSYRSKAKLSEYALNIPKLYCLMSYNSASSSELLVNALRGIDFEVVIIGENTHGKNVGMEPGQTTASNDAMLNKIIDDYLCESYLWNEEYKSLKRNLSIAYSSPYDNFLHTTLMGMTTNTLDRKLNTHTNEYSVFSYVQYLGGSYYEIVPITFQSYNAKVESDFAEGFTPDYEVSVDIIRDFATLEDPLYAKAVELITGNSEYNQMSRLSADTEIVKHLPFEHPATRLSGMIVTDENRLIQGEVGAPQKF